jgi:molecular chaperone IbpA
VAVEHIPESFRVSGASLDNSLLRIERVHKVPEAEKPRRIPIGVAAPQPQPIERKAA